MRESTSRRPDAAEDLLDDLLEEIAARLQRREPVDVEAYAARYPEHAERLRRVVHGLRAVVDLGRSALDPDAPGPPTAVSDPPLGQLGDFRLVREVGRGGMGVVYEAEQISLRRRVALKVLPFAAALDSRQIQRFQLEAQAAACLHHPHIVPVHGVGCERGVHYYAMQLIDGHSLADTIAELRRLDGLDPGDAPAPVLEAISTTALAQRLLTGGKADVPNGVGSDTPTVAEVPAPAPNEASATASPDPDRRPTHGSSTRSRTYVRATARLALQAAEALDHAHARGILHRDIKPGNLLLDAQGGLWVTDFGLAQIRGDDRLTRSGDVLGTLRYMSPEQATGRRVVIDGRTDVYSLGVTLYELLTLRPAVDGPDRAEILRRVAEQEPVPPRRLNPAVPIDLETIVLKATAKDPAARYATAGDLTEDLRRFLDDQSILARRVSLMDRAAKWTRRHAAVVASAALLLILSVVALAAGATLIAQERDAANDQARRTREMAALAQARQLETERERQRAEANFHTARDAVDRMFTRAAQDLADVPHMEQVRRALLEDALEFYQGFLAERSSDPIVTRETARASIQVGIIYLELGRYDQAEELLREAIALLESLSEKPPPVPEIQLDLARCYRNLASLHFLARRTPEATEGWRKTLAIREQLAADFPTVPAYARELSQAHTDLANTLSKGEARFGEAEEHHRRALAIWKEQEEDFPDVPEDRAGEAHLRQWWGALLADTGRLREAEAEYRKAMALREQLVAEAPTSRNRADLHHITQYLGSLIAATGRPDQAEPFLRQAIEIGERLRDDFPHIPGHRQRLGGDYLILSDVLLAMGRIQEAEEAIRRCAAIRTALVEEFPGVQTYPWLLANSDWVSGLILHRAGRVEEAADAFRRALEVYEEIVAEAPEQMPAVLSLAEVLVFCPAPQFRDEARAVGLIKRALQRTPTIGCLWLGLGTALYRTGDREGAIGALTRSMDLGNLNTAEAPRSPFILAMAHWREGECDEARAWYDKAVASMEQGPSHDEILRQLRTEAAALLRVEAAQEFDGQAAPSPPED